MFYIWLPIHDLNRPSRVKYIFEQFFICLQIWELNVTIAFRLHCNALS